MKIQVELTEDQTELLTWLLEDHLAKVRHPEAEAFATRLIFKLAKAKS